MLAHIVESYANPTKLEGLRNRIRQLNARPDVRRNPCLALYKRMVWHTRQAIQRKPWTITMDGDLRLRVRGTGPEALIYYQGHSEPNTANFIKTILQEGMTFVDVGAYIGEYTLLASRLVGKRGHVHAFEARESTAKLLAENIALNRLSNVSLRESAIADRDGVVQFEMAGAPALSGIAGVIHLAGRAVESVKAVASMRLDTYLNACAQQPDLIKVDVEGAEIAVLRGAEGLLADPTLTPPVWVLEYSPHNCSRFSYGAEELLAWLGHHGYETFQMTAGALVPFVRQCRFEDTIDIVAIHESAAGIKKRIGLPG